MPSREEGSEAQGWVHTQKGGSAGHHWCLLGNFCLPKNFVSLQSCCDYYSGYDCCYPRCHCCSTHCHFQLLASVAPVPFSACAPPTPTLTALLLLKENPYTSGFLCIFALLTEYDRREGGDVFTSRLMGHQGFCVWIDSLHSWLWKAQISLGLRMDISSF